MEVPSGRENMGNRLEMGKGRRSGAGDLHTLGTLGTGRRLARCIASSIMLPPCKAVQGEWGHDITVRRAGLQTCSCSRQSYAKNTRGGSRFDQVESNRISSATICIPFRSSRQSQVHPNGAVHALPMATSFTMATKSALHVINH